MNPSREILRLAIPSIVANITTPLLGLVDMAIVGHLGSPTFMAAIALGGTCFSMIYWTFAFLRGGISGMTAQACGAGNLAECRAVYLRGIAVAWIIGGALIALRIPFTEVLLQFMEPDAITEALTRKYIAILIWGAPASMSLYVVHGYLVGMQNTRATMWISLIVNVSNIALSLILVYALHLGISGVATGTLAAQWTGCLIGMAWCGTRGKTYPVRRLLADWKKLRRFFSVNADIFLRTVCLVAVTVWFTHAGALQSDVILSVNALLMQLFLLFSYIMDGFAYAGEAIVGKFTGANDAHARRLSIKSLFRFGAALAFLFTAIYALCGDWILSLLTSEESVREAAHEFRWWAVSIPFAGVGAFIWDGVYIGETRTRGMLLSMAVAVAVFFAVYFALWPLWGNHALWLAFVLYLAVRGLMQTLLYSHNQS